jgi:fatty-acid desaturase
MLWEIEKKNVDQNVFIFKISRHSDNSLSVILFVLPLFVLLIKDYMTMPLTIVLVVIEVLYTLACECLNEFTEEIESNFLAWKITALY